MTWTLVQAHRWTEHGTELLDEQISTLSEAASQEPSALPGWSRKALIAHVSGNAEALRRLVRWAHTGEETPMYSSPQQRLADIDSGDSKSVAELRGWFGRSARDLAHGMDHLPAASWSNEVLTGQGRTVPATFIPWLRAREVMVHAVDLRTGLTFDDLPVDFLAALGADVVARRNAAAVAARPSATLIADDVSMSFHLEGTDQPRTFHGELAAVASYLTGRSDGRDLTSHGGAAAPQLPPWL